MIVTATASSAGGIFHQRIGCLAAMMALCLAGTFDAGPTRAGTPRITTDLLECRSSQALAADLDQVSEQAESAGFSCRHQHTGQYRSLACQGNGRIAALSSTIKEFTLSQTNDGGASLSVALNGSVTRIARALESREQDDPPDHLAVELREDGSAELHCRLAATDRHDASIAGRLSFRGVEPLPAMRVCAAPAADPDHPICSHTATGEHHYRIGSLAAGRYFVTAFPLDSNPNRLFVVHASPSVGCVDDAATCATTQLQAVELSSGQARDGIDLSTVLPDLPPSLGRRHR